MKLSHETEAFAILLYLFTRIFELLWFYMSVLQHLRGEWCAHHLLWKHTGALGIHFSTYFQQWLWSVMHKNKECCFSRKGICNTLFFQSRMRSPERFIKHRSYSQTMCFLFVRLKRMKIAALKEIRGQYERARSWSYTSPLCSWWDDVKNIISWWDDVKKIMEIRNCSLISLFGNSFLCSRVSEKLQVVPINRS